MALKTDGIDDWGRIPSAAALRPASAWAVSIWAKPTTLWNIDTARRVFVGKRNDWHFEYGHVAGKLSFGMGATETVDHTVDLAAGKLFHVAAVREGGANYAQVRLYYNGAQVATGTPFNFGYGDYPVMFGAHDTVYPFWADVTLAEISCGPVNLSTAQVQMLYAGGLPVQNMPQAVFGSNLTAYWSLDDRAAGTVLAANVIRDKSANGHNGDTVASAPVFAGLEMGFLGAGPITVVRPPATDLGALAAQLGTVYPNHEYAETFGR